MKKSPPTWLNGVAVTGIIVAVLGWAVFKWDSTYYRVPKFIESKVYSSSPSSGNPVNWIAIGVRELRKKKGERSQIAEARSYMRDYPLPTLQCGYSLLDSDPKSSVSGQIEFRADGTYRFDPPLPGTGSTPLSTTGEWSMNSKGSVLTLICSSGKSYRSETRGFFKIAGGHVFFDLPAEGERSFSIQIGF